jgi:glutamine---fructose-6-phosphate transaminase (isomerizing)
MCGIVGYIGPRQAAAVLLPALRRLEYRGYDSAGLATVHGITLDVRKTAGKIGRLEDLLRDDPPRGCVGIAHTRWATHGRPSDANAHPHVDCGARVAIVHNGIIENYRELRGMLSREGHHFHSETDTEVIAHLIERYRQNGLPEAMRQAARALRGAYAVACIAGEEPGMVVAVRRGNSPLVLGIGAGEVFLASDIPAFLGETREVLVLEEGELVVLTTEGIHLSTLAGQPVRRNPSRIVWDREAAEKGGYPHFMLKEISEQPNAVRDTLRDRVDPEAGEVLLPELGLSDQEIRRLTRLCFVACGTSLHAALVGKYLVEAFARLPVEVDVASEFRYRQPVLDRRVLVIPISQSGETADTLAALREAREQGARSVAICNIVGSSVAREADGVIYTRAGLEIGVASTKAFTAQLAALVLLALKLGRARGGCDRPMARHVLKGLMEIPDLMGSLLEQDEAIRALAMRFATSRDCLYLGRGIHYPVALEGALKLKEIAYIHAEGHPAGEMKHGPIALIDAHMPVVAIAPRGPTYEKMAANIEEVKARDGIVLAVATVGDSEVTSLADAVLSVPPALYWLQPLLVSVPLQLLAYHIAVLRGCDVDQPRNLAKSVTVE